MQDQLSCQQIYAAVARARRSRSDALGRILGGARVRGYAVALGVGIAALWAAALILSPPAAEAEASTHLGATTSVSAATGD